MSPRYLTLIAPFFLSGHALAEGEKPSEEKTAEEGAPAPGHSHVGEAFDEGPRQAGRKMDGTGDVHFPITTSWSRGQTPWKSWRRIRC